MITITNNLKNLTQAEKKIVDAAFCYEYLHGIGVICLNNWAVWWNCTNSTDAKVYLDGRNVPKFKKGVER